jgi:Cu(I)/Ag(I) efflux system membrane protein CusA/SilA
MLSFAIRNALLTLAATVAIAAAGWWGWRAVPVDAIPDISDNQVVVWAQWPGKSPQDVDIQITQRLTLGLQGLAGVKTVRGLSMYGAGYAYVIFDDRRAFYDCRTRVLERLATLQAELPAGVTAQLGPDATALGQVFAFTLQGNGDLESRRRVLDQVVRPALAAVAGVSEVAPVGGMVREYQIDVDPTRLEEQGLSLEMVMMAIRRSGRDVGAMSVESSGLETMIRGVGFVRGLRDVEDLMVRGDKMKGAGVRLGDLADVHLGGAVRQGVLADDGEEQVGAVVVMRVGEDPQALIARVKEGLAALRPALQREGLAAVPYYDRSQLIAETRETLSGALREELLTTMAVVVVFLLHARASLAIGLTLPLGTLFTFAVMHLLGVGANLMSLGGIAIAIGVMVDMGIIMTENIVQHLLALRERLERQGLAMPASPWDARVVEAVVAGAREVAPAIATASCTTIVDFLPIFALDEQAGKLFSPLALTKTLAIGGAVLFGVFLVPLLCRLLLVPWRLPRAIGLACAGLAAGFAFAWYLGGIGLPLDHDRWRLVVPGWLAAPAMAALAGGLVWRLGSERLVALEDNPVSRLVHHAYRALLGWVLEHKAAFLALCATIALSGWLVGLGYPALAAPLRRLTASLGGDLARTAPDQALARAFPGLGESFLPPLDEGSLLYMPSILSQGGLGESLRIMAEQNRLIRTVPEVATVMGKLGRAETALDPAPIGMVETIITLKPLAAWPVAEILGADGRVKERRPRTMAEVRQAILAISDIPGVAPSLLQPIETRVVMLSTGIKSIIALQVSGDDAEALERFAVAAEPLIATVPGAADVTAQREGGKGYAEVRLDRRRMARFGIDAEAVASAVEAALGGMPLAWSVEGNQRYGLRLRYARERRDDADELGLVQVPVPGAMHGAIPLLSLVDAPVIHRLAFHGVDPLAWRKGLPIELARNLTVLSPTAAELTLPAGTELPAGILPAVPATATGASFVALAGSAADPRGLTWTTGPMSIRSVDGKRVSYVLVNARGRSEVEVVDEAERRLSAALADGRLALPAGATYRWVGRYQQKLHADAILRVVVTVSLAVMVLLIYLGTRRWLTTLVIVGCNVPVTVAGGFLAVAWWGSELTTAVTVGFLALLGVMFNDGIVMGVYLDEQFKDAPGDVAGVRGKVLAAGLRRIRPALMTNLCTLIGLLPLLWADGRGADIMQPMALPCIGGMVVDLVSLFSVPCLYCLAWEWRVARAARTVPGS